jgi:hypothetical protein
VILYRGLHYHRGRAHDYHHALYPCWLLYRGLVLCLFLTFCMVLVRY